MSYFTEWWNAILIYWFRKIHRNDRCNAVFSSQDNSKLHLKYLDSGIILGNESVQQLAFFKTA